MELYKRQQYNILIDRLKEPRHFIQVIVGPRQIGKSTLIKQVVDNISIPHYLYNADTVDFNNNQWISETWESARVRMKYEKVNEVILVFDEIQKLKNWSEFVKREWDFDTLNEINIKVVLLGSSRLLLKHGLTESLAGRFELIRMGHWSYTEMNEAFGYSLDEWIYWGGYPASTIFKDDIRRWRKYVKDSLIAPAIEKDVILTSNIYKPALMKQLFEIGCSYSSEIVSLTKILGQMTDAGNVTTLYSYLEILNQCNLLCGINKFANDVSRKYQSIPKWITYNNALLTAYKGIDFKTDRFDTKNWGRWVESAVGAYIISQAEDEDIKVYYWRERDEVVDFILQYHADIVAIEVKSGRRGMNKGLPNFSKKFNPKRAIIVGTNGIPLETFFKVNISTLFE
ncbi:MAG: AAA family ATPase [Bacteroidales bacterium]|nr:AAA family ATPase [Bacteroidales bacterium]